MSLQPRQVGLGFRDAEDSNTQRDVSTHIRLSGAPQ
jgi:hypothetical protein